MAKYQVRRLPVVYDTRLVGVLAQADIADEAERQESRSGVGGDSATHTRARPRLTSLVIRGGRSAAPHLTSRIDSTGAEA